MNFDIVVFGRRLRALRKARRLSQVPLSMNLNIATQHLSNIENGQRRPSIELMTQMAQYFHISLDTLALGAEYSPDTWREINVEFSHGLAHLEKAQLLLETMKPENPHSA